MQGICCRSLYYYAALSSGSDGHLIPEGGEIAQLSGDHLLTTCSHLMNHHLHTAEQSRMYYVVQSYVSPAGFTGAYSQERKGECGVITGGVIAVVEIGLQHVQVITKTIDTLILI